MNDIDVLLVEPDDTDAKAITYTLESLGSVTRAVDLGAAWTLLGLRPFDIILTEYTFSTGHGFDLLELGIPLVMLTGEVDPHAIIRAMQHGVTDYLIKETGYLNKLRLTVSELVADHRRKQVSKHLAFDSSIAGRIRMTSDCRPIACNDKAAELLGYADQKEAIQQGSWRLHFPEEVQNLWANAKTDEMITQNHRALLYGLDHDPLIAMCNIATLIHPEGGAIIDVAFLDVTDRLGIGTAPTDGRILEQSYAWITHILNNTLDVIIVTDEQGGILHANTSFEMLFWHTPPETIFDLFPPPHDLLVAALIDDALNFNMRLMDEMLIQQADGKQLFVEVNITTMEAGAHTQNVILTIHNVDERKRAEELLAQSEADLRAIFENTSVGFMLLGPDMSVRTANDMATEIVQEILGSNLAEGEEPKHLDAFVSDFQVSLDGLIINSDLTLEIDGQLRDFELTFIPVQDDRENIIGVCLSTEDITARRRAELALFASEKRYRTISELISDYAYSLKPQPDGTFAIGWITDAPFKRLTGYDASQFTTMQQIIETMMFTEEHERALNDLVFCLMGNTTTDEYRIHTADGKTRWLQATRRPIWDDKEGAYNEIVAAVRDISIERYMEQALRDALDQERDVNELKSRFISMVSHEFRTPLATILASTDMLSKYLDRMSPEQREERFTRIRTQITRMTDLMEDVLSLARYEAGAGKFMPQQGDLVAFLRDLVEEFKQTYPTHHVQCMVSLDSLTYAFDPNLVRQITLNLLTNAQKYSPDGSTITVEMRINDAHVEIAFSDEGIGIPEEDQKKLFTAFHRASNVGTIQGTGLGLSILKHAVDQHKGRITFKSKVGQGTTFTVFLPL